MTSGVESFKLTNLEISTFFLLLVQSICQSTLHDFSFKSLRNKLFPWGFAYFLFWLDERKWNFVMWCSRYFFPHFQIHPLKHTKFNLPYPFMWLQSLYMRIKWCNFWLLICKLLGLCVKCLYVVSSLLFLLLIM